MYNYQIHLKEQAIAQHCQNIRKEQYHATIHRQKVNPALAHSHTKRVEAFILSVLEKPIQVQQYHNNTPAFRNQDNSKNLSADGFYLRHQNQASRIEESLKKNKELDQVPFNNTFSHRFRQTGAPCKPMKYKAINHHFRIKEHLDRQGLNYLPNHCDKQIDFSLRKDTSKSKNVLQSLNRTLNKSLLPILHNKTYFKSVATLYSTLPPNQTKSEYRQAAPYADYLIEDDCQPKKDVPKPNQPLNRSENSRQALIKCNMLQLHAHYPRASLHLRG